ncbi:siderophore-interacting protein [Maribrevibacterium harenarium]|uniref:siderophore-interacting protein n=1 Tax=Maribrevibacterium harenarium TaxID=2589817 RepID=UPI001F2462F4|nr:siderophore-interacting protein [Maribrevibacterium harenarium]
MEKKGINAHPLQVVYKTQVTPNMLRITLKGNAVRDYPENHASGYIKLVFPQAEGRPLVRTYTIRAHQEDQIDVDFAIHGDHGDSGPACHWAQTCEIGDEILVGGPGPKKLAADAEHYLFIGDMTSLPAISVNLSQLPANAKGYAIVEITSESDKQSLPKPQGIEMIWVVNPHPGEESVLANKVRELDQDWSQTSIWAACEFSSMRSLRQYFFKELSLAKDKVYVSSYWKFGLSEDNHKVVKQQDALQAELEQ